MVRSTIAEIRQKLQESRYSTWQLIQKIDEETAHFRPRPDAWNVKDHVAHLAAVEEAVIRFSHRILHEDGPISPLCYEKAFNQDAWNNHEVAKRANDSWAETTRNLRETRQALLDLLDRISEESLNRVGSHPAWGAPVTLASVLRVPYRHERAHRDEILALCRLKGLNL